MSREKKDWEGPRLTSGNEGNDALGLVILHDHCLVVSRRLHEIISIWISLAQLKTVVLGFIISTSASKGAKCGRDLHIHKCNVSSVSFDQIEFVAEMYLEEYLNLLKVTWICWRCNRLRLSTDGFCSVIPFAWGRACTSLKVDCYHDRRGKSRIGTGRDDNGILRHCSYQRCRRDCIQVQ